MGFRLTAKLPLSVTKPTCRRSVTSFVVVGVAVVVVVAIFKGLTSCLHLSSQNLKNLAFRQIKLSQLKILR